MFKKLKYATHNEVIVGTIGILWILALVAVSAVLVHFLTQKIPVSFLINEEVSAEILEFQIESAREALGNRIK